MFHWKHKLLLLSPGQDKNQFKILIMKLTSYFTLNNFTPHRRIQYLNIQSLVPRNLFKHNSIKKLLVPFWKSLSIWVYLQTPFRENLFIIYLSGQMNKCMYVETTWYIPKLYTKETQTIFFTYTSLKKKHDTFKIYFTTYYTHTYTHKIWQKKGFHFPIILHFPILLFLLSVYNTYMCLFGHKLIDLSNYCRYYKISLMHIFVRI